jgi:hypothetical protein
MAKIEEVFFSRTWLQKQDILLDIHAGHHAGCWLLGNSARQKMFWGKKSRRKGDRTSGLPVNLLKEGPVYVWELFLQTFVDITWEPPSA